VIKTLALEPAEARATRTVSIIAGLAQRISLVWKDNEEPEIPGPVALLSISAPQAALDHCLAGGSPGGFGREELRGNLNRQIAPTESPSWFCYRAGCDRGWIAGI
jgi:hypothetical protein